MKFFTDPLLLGLARLAASLEMASKPPELRLRYSRPSTDHRTLSLSPGAGDSGRSSVSLAGRNSYNRGGTHGRGALSRSPSTVRLSPIARSTSDPSGSERCGRIATRPLQPGGCGGIVRPMPKDYFDEPIASRYDADSALMFDPAIVDPAVAFLADLAGVGRALEFGIGTGRIALPLSRRGVPVHGIDLSEAMVGRPVPSQVARCSP
jgi:hypothetical protein